MILNYTFYSNGREYEYEYEPDFGEVLAIVREALEEDGYDYEEADEKLIAEYMDICWDEIKEHFYDEARKEWKENKSYKDDPLGYYGFSVKDFV